MDAVTGANTMNVLMKKLVPAGAVAILACAAACLSQDIASDFQQALDTVPEQPKWPSGIMYYDVQKAADSLIEKHKDASTLEFLRAKLEGDLRSKKLALLSLARLAACQSGRFLV
jgi:hypothetical protein